MSTDAFTDRSPSALPAPARHTSGAPVHRWVIASLVVALGAHLVANALSVSTTVAEQVSFAFVALVLSVVTVLRPHGLRRYSLAPILHWWVGYAVLQLLLFPVRPATSGVLDFFTDFVVVLVPALGAMALERVGTPVGLHVLLTWYVGLGTFASIVSYVMTPSGLRMEAPVILVISGAWALAAAPKARTTSVSKLVGWLAVVVLLALVVESRSRTSLAAYAVAAVICFALYSTRTRALLVAGVIGLSALLWYTAPDDRSTTAELAQQMRIRADTSGAIYGTDYRVTEAKDAYAGYATDATAWNYLLGQGHGATFVPHDPQVATKANAAGRVHHVHFTPVTILLRYGVVGLFLFLALLVAVGRWALQIVRRGDIPPASMAAVAGLTGYFFDLMVRNSLVDPGLALTIALLHFYRPRSATEV